MKGIGLGHLMRELDGWRLATTENSSMRVIGKGIAAGLSMTTAGIGADSGTNVAILAATIATTAAAKRDD